MLVGNENGRLDPRLFDPCDLLRLWHVGRISHPLLLQGRQPVAPSAIAAQGHVSLLRPQQSYVVPRELALDEIPAIIDAFRQAARNAKAAGFESIWDDVREAKFHMDRIRRLSLLIQEHMFFIVGEHEEILERLKAHDAEGADRSIGVHLTSVVHELDMIRAKHPEYFIRDARGQGAP